MATFGETIARWRKDADLSQKELASQVKKEDGEAISPQYLNDLEHGRRNPPSQFLMEQFAKVLNGNVEVLLFCAGEIQPDLMCLDVPEDQVVAAYKAFRRVLRKEDQ